MNTTCAPITLALLMTGLFSAQPAHSENIALVEVPVQRVLFPATGYNDRDTVQVRIEGDLPDPCYELSHTTLSRNATGGFLIHPHAWRHSSTDCDTGDLLGESPYAEEVSLGQLKAGDYGIAFAPEGSSIQYRQLHIGTAPRITDRDDSHIAPISDAEIPAIVLEGHEVKVILRGQLSSPCDQLEEPVPFERQEDAIVLRPLERAAETCSAASGIFVTTVDLGVLPPGEYLVHVRGRNTQFIDQTFTVVRTHSDSPTPPQPIHQRR